MNSLKIDENLILELQKEIPKHLGSSYISLLNNPDTTLESGREKIYQDFLPQYNDAVSEFNKKTSEIKQQLIKIQNTEKQIKNYENKQAELKKEIEDLESRFYAYFPDKLRDEAREKNINDSTEYFIRLLNINMGFFEGIFSPNKYNKIAPDLDKIRTEIVNKQNELYNIKTQLSRTPTVSPHKKDELNKELEKLRTDLDKKISKISEEMHYKMALFQRDFNSPQRDVIPPLLSWGKLDEPVCFFEKINGTDKAHVENLLKRIGLPVSEDGLNPNAYWVREHHDGVYNCLELVTPFYSSINARNNITTIMHYLSRYGVGFRGIVQPVRHYQVDPTILVDKTTESTKDPATALAEILRDSEHYTPIDDEDIHWRLANDEHVFRGTSFSAHDSRAAYATPTWRVGRTGIVYGSINVGYTAAYAGGRKNNETNAGETIKSEHVPKINGKKIGILNVFKRNKKTLSFYDARLEDVSEMKFTKKEIQKEDFYESALNPTDNPLVARYFVYDGKYYLIDDNPNWKIILDSMVPDLSVTHITGVSGKDYPKASGRNLLKRLEQYRNQIHENRAITTNDLTNEQIHAMGGKTIKEKLDFSTHELKQKQPYIDMGNIHE